MHRLISARDDCQVYSKSFDVPSYYDVNPYRAESVEFAVTIEGIDFLPPSNRNSYKGWVKDEVVFY